MSNEVVPQDNEAAPDPALLADLIENQAAPEEEPAPPAGPSFDSMNLSREVREALDDMGYFTPTPVQAAVFQPLSEGKDLMVQARTGTGKTAAFGLPILEALDPAKE